MMQTSLLITEDQKFTTHHFKILFLCGLLVFLDGFDLVVISYVGPEMMQALGMTKPMFGTVLSCALFGLAVGALAGGLCADRYGRRIALNACGIVFGIGSIATALSTSYESLLVWRFVTGLGLGGATPIAVALISEFMPKHLKASLVIVLYTNISLGGIAGGFVSGMTLPYGWQTIFWIGGVLPLLLSPLLIAFLPESAEFLASKTNKSRKASIPGSDGPAAPAAEAFPLREIFAGHYANTTLILWFVFFVALISLYFYYTWLPTLLISGGLSVNDVVIIGGAGQLGTLLGSFLLARLASSIRPFILIACCYVGAAIVLALFGRIGTSFWLWVPVSFLAGALVAGTQIGCNAVTALVYPPRSRATGVGWALGIGRIGGILGPLIAGLLLGRGWTNAELFSLAALGPALAAIGCFCVAQRLAHVPVVEEPLEKAVTI